MQAYRQTVWQTEKRRVKKERERTWEIESKPNEILESKDERKLRQKIEYTASIHMR